MLAGHSDCFARKPGFLSRLYVRQKTIIMKNSVTFLMLIFSLSAFSVFTSCGKEKGKKPSKEEEPSEKYFLTALVDGVSFGDPNDTNGGSMHKQGGTTYLILGLEENSGRQIYMLIDLTDPSTTGTFTSMSNGVEFRYADGSINLWVADESSGSGTLTITESTSDYVKGTFSFTGVDSSDNSTVQVTQGEFKAKKLF